MRTVFLFAMMVSLAFLVGCQPGEEAPVGEAPAAEAPAEDAPVEDAPVEDAPVEDAAAPAMSDEEAFNQALVDFTAAWNVGDASAIAAFFAEDGDTMVSAGHFEGREAVEGYYRESFDVMYKGTTITLAMTSLRFLQPDVAVADGSFEVAGIKNAEGQDMPNVKGLYTNIRTKVGDQWLIVCSRTMIPGTPPGTT